eukprot:TRINITY_DN70_c1_g1_i1.p1 TRINITY_DN70_c1_g1~~TRINITY_DN70_c1_g1_i1.p1  ORF type:complete len:407 (+),score=95.04 TRINITY_DN70_c1_g1_i1:1213-2433(+)
MRLIHLLGCLLAASSVIVNASGLRHLKRQDHNAATPSSEANLHLLDGSAKCLDGSPAGFYHRLQSAKSSSWIVHFQGGGYCYNAQTCLQRSTTDLGSSLNWPQVQNFSGFLSADPAVNPHFYDWNVIFIQYCDGAFFASNRGDQPINVSGGQQLYLSGKNIVENTFSTLLNDFGMNGAEEIIITGCSAGGVAVFLHLDWIRALIPANIRVVGFADSGFFLDIPNYKGEYIWGPVHASGMALHNATFVDDDCLAAENESYRCSLSQYAAQYVQTPLFVMNSLADAYQMKYMLMLDCYYGGHALVNCSDEEMSAVHAFRTKMVADLKSSVLHGHSKKMNGAFLPTCVTHCGVIDPAGTPHFWENTVIHNVKLRDAFVHWYYKRPIVHNRVHRSLVDGQYPSEACDADF